MQTIRLHSGKKIVVNKITAVSASFINRSTIRSEEYGRHYLGAYTLGQAKPKMRFEVCVRYFNENNEPRCIYDVVEDYITGLNYLISIGYEG